MSLFQRWQGALDQLKTQGRYRSFSLPRGTDFTSNELNHACIVDGLRLAKSRRFAFRHNDLNHLEEGLKAEVQRNDPDRARFIITESLFSMDGDTAPLREIAKVAGRFGAHLIVDEAHSTGCFGETGSGCVDAAGVRDQVLATMHTGGKGLGVSGAYLACSCLLREYLGAHYVVPVVVGDDARAVAAATALQRLGHDVRAIRPPSVPPGTSRLRISIHADHDPALLVQLARDTAEALSHG